MAMEKRIIVPALFGIFSIIFIAVYASVLISVPMPVFYKILAVSVVFAVAAALVFLINQRIGELKEEDKDDLSKY